VDPRRAYSDPRAGANPFDRAVRRRAGGVRDAVTRGPYLERLGGRTAVAGTVLCLGIDPDPAHLPPGFPAGLAGIERFARLIVEAAAPLAAAVKPNLAFFEAYGSAGLAALERVRAAVPAGIPVVIDAKRADIGTTSARQAAALFDALGADAVTVNPYLGAAAIEPLLERLDRYAYVLCRTSNPGAGELQDLVVSADPDLDAPSEQLWARVARRVAGWGPGGTVGLVVGATAPRELAAIRAIAPGLGFLVPGVGAQGGEVEPVLRDGRAAAPPAGVQPGGGLLVNVSRGIATAATQGPSGEASEGARGDPAERLAEAAAGWARRLPVLP
jgi:orotidine-5'-phosphate decarboxylase